MTRPVPYPTLGMSVILPFVTVGMSPVEPGTRLHMEPVQGSREPGWHSRPTLVMTPAISAELGMESFLRVPTIYGPQEHA